MRVCPRVGRQRPQGKSDKEAFPGSAKDKTLSLPAPLRWGEDRGPGRPRTEPDSPPEPLRGAALLPSLSGHPPWFRCVPELGAAPGQELGAAALCSLISAHPTSCSWPNLTLSGSHSAWMLMWWTEEVSQWWGLLEVCLMDWDPRTILTARFCAEYPSVHVIVLSWNKIHLWRSLSFQKVWNVVEKVGTQNLEISWVLFFFFK